MYSHSIMNKIFVCILLWTSLPFMSATRIVSTSSDNNICEFESFYGTSGYIDDMQEISQTLAGIENGYLNLKLYIALPMNSGCHFNELEVVVVDPDQSETQELLDLRDDIQNNCDRIMEVKLIIISNLNELPWQLRFRLADVRIPIVNQLRGQINRRVEFQIETDLRLMLFQIATESDIIVANIRINGMEVTVQLADRNGNGDRISRSQRSRFTLLARARTRRRVVVV
jgi:hypothetical protein